jgi:hypothetical protein
MRHGAIIAAAFAFALAPNAVRALVVDPEGLLGRVPRQCDAGLNVGCGCAESSAMADCPGARCLPVPLKATAKGILTIVADDRIDAYKATTVDASVPPDAGGAPTTRAFTLLLDIKVGGRQHLLSETYQDVTDPSLSPSGEERVVDEQALVDLFGSMPPPADPSRPLVYFAPGGAFKRRLQSLLGGDALKKDVQPVLIGFKKLEYGDGGGKPLATALSLKVGLASVAPSRVCSGATPVSTDTPAITPTPIQTATVQQTASATITAMPGTTPAASRTPTPVATAVVTVTAAPAATSTSIATATIALAATATLTPTGELTATPAVTSTPATSATASAVPSSIETTPTVEPAASPTATSGGGSEATPTPVPAGVPAVTLDDRTIPLRSRGNDTYVRVTLTNPTTADLGRIPYTATFAIVPADGQVTVTTFEIEGRPVVNAGFRDYLRIGITTATDAPPGEHQVIGVFRFSPSTLPAGAPPIEITETARVRIE